MIYLYTGTPGSGKSLHLAEEIYLSLKFGMRVIVNFPVNKDIFYKRSIFGKRKLNPIYNKITYIDNKNLNVTNLINYARNNNIYGKERQVLLAIDECQYLFNPREFSRSDRLAWINFFAQHRKLGYDVILVTQNDRLIDRQIRCNVEYEVKHRKVNNYKLGVLIPFKLFVAVGYWYGVKEKVSVDFFRYHKMYGNMYDSFRMFESGASY